MTEAEDLLLMSGFIETMDQHTARWYGHVLRKVLRFEVEGQGK